MKGNCVRVVKVGGSLLDVPTLADALSSWMDRQSSAAHVLVAGGGAMADVIRQADRRHGLDLAEAHWICVGLLSVSARLLAAILPRSTLIMRFDELQRELASGQPRRIIFAVEDFLRNERSLVARPPLPCDWRVSSDSIAAQLARAVQSQELALLKSTDAPAGITKTAASQLGLVDDFFPIAAAPLSLVRWVNLRNPQAPETTLR